jgi:hypothetical protein
MTMIADLKFPIQRDCERRGGHTLNYQTGVNCRAIERDPGGGWWVIVDNHAAHWVPDAHVESVQRDSEDMRYSRAPEPELQSYATKVDGGYKCDKCPKVCPTPHGLKTHHGSHERE